MKTSPGRALVPALGAALTAPILLLVTTLISEVIDEEGPSTVDSARLWFVEGLAPMGWTGLVGDPMAGSEGRARLALLAGLMVLALVVFATTWLTASSLAPGSWAVPVFFGGWFGAVLGGGLGATTASLVVNQSMSEVRDFGPGQWWYAHSALLLGSKWGLLAGALVGMLAVVLWLVRRPRATASAETRAGLPGGSQWGSGATAPSPRPREPDPAPRDSEIDPPR